MKQVIPFYKEIVFKNKIANLTSISLEHNEKVVDGEVSGEFIVYGDYKVHNDTTEKEEFNYKLPFTALLPDDIDLNTVKVDITDFKYDQIDEDVLRIDIDFSIEGDTLECLDEREEVSEEDTINEEIDEILGIKEEVETLELPVESMEEEVQVREDTINEEIQVIEKAEEKIETMEEYVTYHVHVVGSNDSVENIMKLYNTNLDMLNQYNDIKELKIGDKVIIPEYNE